MDNDLLLISDYLAGDISPEDQSLVERRLLEDPVFEDQFQQRKAEIEIIRAADRARVKEGLRQQLTQEKTPIRFMSSWWIPIAIAASIAIFLLILLPNSSPGPQQLAMSYLEPMPIATSRGAEVGSDERLKRAFSLYQQGNYAAALPELEELLAQIPENEQIALLVANAYSQTGRFDKSISLYQPWDHSSPYWDVVEWNLALALVLEDRLKEAIPLLTQISEGNHFKAKQAAKLLSELE